MGCVLCLLLSYCCYPTQCLGHFFTPDGGARRNYRANLAASGSPSCSRGKSARAEAMARNLRLAQEDFRDRMLALKTGTASWPARAAIEARGDSRAMVRLKGILLRRKVAGAALRERRLRRCRWCGGGGSTTTSTCAETAPGTAPKDLEAAGGAQDGGAARSPRQQSNVLPQQKRRSSESMSLPSPPRATPQAASDKGESVETRMARAYRSLASLYEEMEREKRRSQSPQRRIRRSLTI